MKSKWLISLFGSIPIVAAIIALQSCAGVGGPTTNNGGGGNVTAAFLALLSDEQKAGTAIGPEACADCHGGRDPEDPIYAHWKDTKHASKNVTCESCHGPGSVHKNNPIKANILTFPKSTSPVVCAQCHGPIADQWNFSQHSKLVAAPVEEAIQDPNRYGKTSRCIACHSGLTRTEIIDQGKDLGAQTDEVIREIAENTLTVVPHTATCVTCHNPHKQTGNLNASSEEVQLRHKSFNTDVSQIGPGSSAAMFTQFDHTCAQCHNGRGTNPSDDRLTASTSRPSMHDSNQFNMLMGVGGVEGTGVILRNTAHAQSPGQCSKCHMPDARHTFTVSFDKGCAPCHTAADAAARATSIKSEILSQLVALRTRMEWWATATFDNDLFWEYTSTIGAEGLTAPDRSLVPIEVKRARYNYYFVIRSGDYGVHNAPYAKSLIGVANSNLDALEVPKPPPSRLDRDSMFRLIESDRAKARKAEFSGTN